ncbi:unnamed protein product [Closterium sp. Naga37s-1]|nr:unnamed protein product [Closterium sp. Naga37s-1]
MLLLVLLGAAYAAAGALGAAYAAARSAGGSLCCCWVCWGQTKLLLVRWRQPKLLLVRWGGEEGGGGGGAAYAAAGSYGGSLCCCWFCWGQPMLLLALLGQPKLLLVLAAASALAGKLLLVLLATVEAAAGATGGSGSCCWCYLRHGKLLGEASFSVGWRFQVWGGGFQVWGGGFRCGAAGFGVWRRVSGGGAVSGRGDGGVRVVRRFQVIGTIKVAGDGWGRARLTAVTCARLLLRMRTVAAYARAAVRAANSTRAATRVILLRASGLAGNARGKNRWGARKKMGDAWRRRGAPSTGATGA